MPSLCNVKRANGLLAVAILLLALVSCRSLRHAGVFLGLCLLHSEAAERMHAVSSENIGRRIAFVLDGRIFMAPYMRATLDSPALIDGQFTREEAERIAEQLAP